MLEQRVKELEQEAFLRKQIEEALRASEKRCRAMFESTQEAIITSDSDGIIISANPAAAKIFGFKKPEELIGSQGSERYADLKQREKLFEELIEKGFVKNYELTLKRADGTFVDILGTGTLYRDEQGNIERVEGFLYSTFLPLAGGDKPRPIQPNSYLYRRGLGLWTGSISQLGCWPG